MICDFCGKTLGSANVIVVPPSKVVGATHKGFVPRNLPPSWKTAFEQQGITGVALHVAINAHWKNVVDGNDSEDWGLCSSCKNELDQHFEKETAKSIETKPKSVPTKPDPIETNQESSVEPESIVEPEKKKWWKFW